MTALSRYARLEAPARYFDGVSARPADVLVSFGEHSLVIMGYDGVAVAHWALASLKARSAPGDLSMQVTPEGGSDERLLIEDAEMIQAIEAVCPGLWRRDKSERRGIGRTLAYVVAAVGATVLLVTVILPRLAEQLAVFVPPEQEALLGDAVVGQLQSILAYGDGGRPGFCSEGEGQEALAAMEARLTTGLELPYPLRVSVLDHEMVNAFAVPGGRIVLFRGLIESAETPEEVAGVLAHEMGHVIHRDPTVGVLRSASTAGILGLMVGDVFGAAVVVAAAEAVRNASYQQDVENRADQEAIRILARAGLPSEPFAAFFRRLADKYGGDMGVLDYLASHPALNDRAERASAGDTLGGGRFDPVVSDKGWIALQQICAKTVEDLPK